MAENLRDKELWDAGEERVALACILKNPELIATLDDFALKPAIFYFKEHQIIFSTLLSIYNEKGGIDPFLVINKLKSFGITSFQGIPISDYIETIGAISCSPKNVGEYFETVCKWYYTRIADDKIKEKRQELRRGATARSLSETVEFVEKANADITTISVSNLDEDFVDIWDKGEEIIREIAQRDKPTGIRCPFDSFHKQYGLMGFGDMIVIGAQKKTGKSTLLRFWGEAIAASDEDTIVLYIDYEMATHQVVSRAIAADTKEKEVFFREGTFKNDPQKVAKAQKTFDKWNNRPKGKMIHLYANRKGIEEIEILVKRFHSRHVKEGKNLLVINDYLKIVTESTDNQKEWEVMGRKGNAFKELAGQLPRTVVLTAIQLNEEDKVAMSARIGWFCTSIFFLRKKSPDQMQRHGDKYGSLILEEYVTRFQGEEYEEFIEIKQGSETKRIKNCINIYSNNFHLEDRGTYKQMVKEIEAKGGQLELAPPKEGKYQRAVQNFGI